MITNLNIKPNATIYYATTEAMKTGEIVGYKETPTAPEFIVFHPSNKEVIESLISAIGGRLVPIAEAQAKRGIKDEQ